MIEIGRLGDIIRYDPQTGRLIWRKREGRTKGERIFNGTFAGRPALNWAGPHGHLSGRITGKVAWAHRVAFALYYGRWPVGSIDHIDGDPSNNRIENLRECSHAENMRNQRRRKTSSAPFKGVKLVKKRWRARITIDGREKHLGYFGTAEEAARAYDVAAAAIHGDFACLNFGVPAAERALRAKQRALDLELPIRRDRAA